MDGDAGTRAVAHRNLRREIDKQKAAVVRLRVLHYSNPRVRAAAPTAGGFMAIKCAPSRPKDSAVPEPDNDRPRPETPPVRPPTLPPDFPDIPQNPYSELQPRPDPGATADKVAGMTPAATEPETREKPPVAPEAP
jgi:hypothetical protein